MISSWIISSSLAASMLGGGVGSAREEEEEEEEGLEGEAHGSKGFTGATVLTTAAVFLPAEEPELPRVFVRAGDMGPRGEGGGPVQGGASLRSTISIRIFFLQKREFWVCSVVTLAPCPASRKEKNEEPRSEKAHITVFHKL
jgi:hypothetical protein